MQKKRPPSGSDGLGLGFTAYVWALLRAGMCHGVTPLPFLAHSWPSTGGCCRTAGACRRRLLTIDARRHHHLLVHMAFCLGHSNRHGNCKYRYRECLQRHLFLPSSPLLAGMMPRLSTQLLLIQFRLIWAIHAHANEGKHCKLRTIPNTTAGFF